MRFPVIVFKRKGELDSCASLGLSVCGGVTVEKERQTKRARACRLDPYFCRHIWFLATNVSVCPGIRLPLDQVVQRFFVL